MLARSPHRKPDTVAVLDVGTSKIVCMNGQIEKDFGVRLLGSGFGVSHGMKAGVVVDMEAVETCIRSAVQKAEREAGVAVQSVAVNLATRSMRSSRITADTDFNSGEVAERDVNRLLGSTLSEASDAEKAILHAIPLDWSIDGERNIQEPRGMFGSNLAVNMHFVQAGIGPLRNLAHCIERCHLSMKSVMVSPYAAGLAVLTEDERDLGVTVIDFGGGTTSVAIFRDNKLAHVDAISVGGQNATNDIARGMMTPAEAAERIKLIYGSALHGANDEAEIIPCPPMGPQDTLHNEPRSVLTGIIRSRVEETLEIIKERINRVQLEAYSGRRIVLTGGGAQLSGVRELTEYVFNKRARVGRPHGILGLKDNLSGPDYAVAVGLLKHEFLTPNEAISGPPDLTGRRYRQKRYAGGGIGRSFKWIKENF